MVGLEAFSSEDLLCCITARLLNRFNQSWKRDNIQELYFAHQKSLYSSNFIGFPLQHYEMMETKLARSVDRYFILLRDAEGTREKEVAPNITACGDIF
jgi:hypothetical protein